MLFYLGIHQQICTGKQHVQFVQIFGNAAIPDFGESEPVLDDMKRVLNFTADRGFAVVNLFFLIDRVVRNFRETFRAACNTKINLAEMRIVQDFFPFFNANISGISIYNFVCFPQ